MTKTLAATRRRSPGSESDAEDPAARTVLVRVVRHADAVVVGPGHVAHLEVRPVVGGHAARHPLIPLAHHLLRSVQRLHEYLHAPGGQPVVVVDVAADPGGARRA